MGYSKKLIDKQEEQYQASLGIALQAGALEECENHTGSYFNGPNDIEDAYNLGDEKFSKGEIANVFESGEEMKETIKRAVEDFEGLDGCPLCAKAFKD
jgi:hypothetical protein